MSLTSLTQIVAELLAAADPETALRIVNRALASSRETGVVLLAFDGRRNTIVGRSSDSPAEQVGASPGGVERQHVALDHLPTAVRNTLLAGERFADVGEQAAQYARLLGITPLSDDIRFFLKGIVLDGVLTAVLAVYEERRRGATKLPERLAPLAAVFELTYARFFEREARFEAVSALHDVTSCLRAEHAGRTAELEREITRLRAVRGDVIDRRRAEELRAAADGAQRRAAAAEERLAAVEAQVRSAVERLEQAHLQVYRQTEELRAQGEVIRRLEAQLEERRTAAPPFTS